MFEQQIQRKIQDIQKAKKFLSTRASYNLYNHVG